MPDKVCPIVLNMFGLAVAPYPSSLPKGVTAGRLLSGYVERSLKRSAVQGFAVRVLRQLVTDAGTKRALTTEQIAEKVSAAPLVVRGCLIALANDGLVRRLHGTLEKWEVAHDFIARLLQSPLRSWQKSAWERSRPYLVQVPLVVLLLATAGVIAWDRFKPYEIRSELADLGLTVTPAAHGVIAERNSRFNFKNFPLICRLLAKLPAVYSLDLSVTRVTDLEGVGYFV
jgi:hypothetical protein